LFDFSFGNELRFADQPGRFPMTSAMLRIGACSMVAWCVSTSAHADDADAAKQIKKLGGRVTNLPAGTMVVFEGKKFTDSHVKYLAEIKNVNTFRCNGTSVTDAGLKELGHFQQLTDVRFFGTKITDDGIRELRGLENLEILFCDSTDFTGPGLKDLKDLKRLQDLNLWGPKITDGTLRYVVELPGVRFLTLTNSAVTDAGLKQLRALKKLQRLSLDGTGITDKGLALFQSVADFEKLDLLTLLNTKVTKAGVDALAKARGTKAIYVTR
jgi:hypothetical protein